MTAILEIRDLSVSYGASRVIFDASLGVRPGSVTVLLGANGAGKTTLLRAICNMMVRTRGEIRLEGQPIENMATEEIARLGVAHVPDGRGTFIHMTVQENLQLGAYGRRDHAAVGDDFERIFAYFPRLRERRAQPAGTLSGGEQQMLAIGRALMSRPKLLLLDEPSFGLAPLVVKEIFDILRAINRADGVSILLVEQNANLALSLADYGYLLETGRIVMHDTASALSNDDSIRRVYLGY
ncbi:MAG: ABC transporter ATP-binding protein [Xanthobacteraceae bacterium]|nr:MAG: ABC transporter ATP-binding protein [Xanthobacteraceae bacterium]